MADLRTALEDAFAQHTQEETTQETGQIEQPAESEKPARARDEVGRFTKAEREAAEKAAAAKPQETQPEAGQVQAPERPARPTSWKKEMWEHFDKLDPTVASYINQREQDFHKGIGDYKTRAQQAEEWNQAVSPFMANFQSVGKAPVQAVRDILMTENLLRNGSAEQKAAVIHDLINSYGVNMSVQPQQQQFRPQFDPNMIGSIVDQRVQGALVQQSAQTALEQFTASAPEHFEAVKETMATLLQNGLASTYQEAYDKATRLHPDIYEQITAKQQEAADAKKREEATKAAAAAKAKAVSVKGASTGGKQPDGNGKDRRSIIKEALGAHSQTY